MASREVMAGTTAKRREMERGCRGCVMFPLEGGGWHNLPLSSFSGGSGLV